MDRTNIKTSIPPERSRAIANNIQAKKEKTPDRSGMPFIQTKLRIGQPGDVYEQEADRVASSVMRMGSNELHRQPMEEEEEMLQTKEIRRQPMEEEEEMLQAKEIRRQPMEEEEEMLQTKEIRRQPMEEEEEMMQPKEIRRQPMEEEEEMLQTKEIRRQPMEEEEEMMQPKEIRRQPMEEEEEMLQAKEIRREPMENTTNSFEQDLSQAQHGGNPLPESTRAFMEKGIGADFSDVRIHHGENARALNERINAQAFTFGNNVFFGEGKYNPGTSSGKELLAHELTHVVQQRGLHRRIQKSPLSDELQTLWESGNKGAFFDHLRTVHSPDLDLNTYVISNLRGDDLWLATNILAHGPESGWPIHLKVEREMKGWSDCGGKGAVFDLLRSANGAESGNMQLLVSLNTVFSPGTNDIWLALNLLRYGIEEQWPLHLRIERAMKGWGDCGGVPEVHDLLRSDNAAHAFDPQVLITIAIELASASPYERWLAIYLQIYGNESNFPMHVGIMNFFYSLGEEGPINTIISTGYTIMTFTNAYDTWEYHADGRIVEVDLSSRLLGNTDRRGTTIRLNAALSHADAAMTLYHELGHVTSTEPDYLEQEIQVRIQTEQFAIDNGLPPTRPNYRRPNGTVNVAAIRTEVMSSSHYNPTDRTRIGRRYEGEAVIGPWALPQ